MRQLRLKRTQTRRYPLLTLRRTNGDLRNVESLQQRWGKEETKEGASLHLAPSWEKEIPMNAKTESLHYWKAYRNSWITASDRKLNLKSSSHLTTDLAALLLEMHDATVCKGPWQNFSCHSCTPMWKRECQKCVSLREHNLLKICCFVKQWMPRVLGICRLTPKYIILSTVPFWNLDT